MLAKIICAIILLIALLFCGLTIGGIAGSIKNEFKHHDLDHISGILGWMTRDYMQMYHPSNITNHQHLVKYQKKLHNKSNKSHLLDYLIMALISVISYLDNPKLTAIYFIIILIFWSPMEYYFRIKDNPNIGRCVEKYNEQHRYFQRRKYWTHKYYEASYISYNYDLFVIGIPAILYLVFAMSF